MGEGKGGGRKNDENSSVFPIPLPFILSRQGRGNYLLVGLSPGDGFEEPRVKSENGSDRRKLLLP